MNKSELTSALAAGAAQRPFPWSEQPTMPWQPQHLGLPPIKTTVAAGRSNKVKTPSSQPRT